MSKPRPTIEDVARVAGVSRATASRVINDAPGASARLRTRVRDAVAALGYRPNQTARALASGRQRAVDVLAITYGPDEGWLGGHPYYSRVLAGMMSVLETVDVPLRLHAVGSDAPPSAIDAIAANATAGVVLANGSMSSRQSGEGDIRAALVEADLVACMVALPPQLFRTTAIPACLWFFSNNKGPQGAKHLADRRGETLFIDARAMGTLTDRTERILTTEDISDIAWTYHAWRGTPSAGASKLRYENIPGFCYSATLEEIRKHDHILTPGRYVGAAEVNDGDAEPIAERIDRLTKELFTYFDESARLEQVVREQLERLDA